MSENSPSPAGEYLESCRRILECVSTQQPQIRQAADWFASSILADGVVHLFGAGHSRILVEEMWPRYGSFPGFNPIVELSLTFHNPVVGANGQRQAMFLERVPGLAERILRNFRVTGADCGLIVSSSGSSTVAVEMAEQLQQRGVKVVAIVSLAHARTCSSSHPRGKRLADCADLVLDTGAPEGDAMVQIEGLSAPVSPGSTVGGCMLINAIKAELAQRLTAAGRPPRVLVAANIAGAEASRAAFEAAYDEHGRRLARLLGEAGDGNSA